MIGAGAAGLGALQVLRDEGFSVDCFERSDRVGGHWHTDYECLHLITPRDSSGFDGFPMPAEYPLFPSRDQMRDYILGFAAAPRPRLAHPVQHGGHVGAAARRERARGLGGHDLRRRAPHLRRRDRRQRPSVGPVRARLSRATSTGTCCTAAGTATPSDLAGRPRARRRRRELRLRPRGRRGAGRPRDATCRCATGWSSSPRRCSAGRARSCRCSAACRSACRSA